MKPTKEQVIKALRCVAHPDEWEKSKCYGCPYNVTENYSRGCDVGRILLDAADELEKNYYEVVNNGTMTLNL